MASTDALQRRLDMYFNRSQENVKNTALNAATSLSQEDMHAFVASMNGMSVAMTTVNQQTMVQHNLAKAIIDALP
jgi:hypothetical protein